MMDSLEPAATFNVYFRNPDSTLGAVVAENYENHEKAIDAVFVALVPEGFKKPFLVLLQGGKKDD